MPGLENNKVIGIVGGMGPQAGVALLNSILSQTKAVTDQQHLSTILMSFPGEMADRTAFLEGRPVANPAFNIVHVIQKLERAGAQVVGIACNTSHSPEIYRIITEQLAEMDCSIRLLHMPEETCRQIAVEHPQARRIGLMTTNGTYRSGVYRNILEKMGFEAIIPDGGFQDAVIHRMVYDAEFGLKACPNPISGKIGAFWERSLRYFEQAGADGIVLGCTEFSLIPHEGIMRNMVMVDSTQCLARALIREATDNENSSKFLVETFHSGRLATDR